MFNVIQIPVDDEPGISADISYFSTFDFTIPAFTCVGFRVELVCGENILAPAVIDDEGEVILVNAMTENPPDVIDVVIVRTETGGGIESEFIGDVNEINTGVAAAFGRNGYEHDGVRAGIREGVLRIPDMSGIAVAEKPEDRTGAGRKIVELDHRVDNSDIRRIGIGDKMGNRGRINGDHVFKDIVIGTTFRRSHGESDVVSAGVFIGMNGKMIRGEVIEVGISEIPEKSLAEIRTSFIKMNGERLTASGDIGIERIRRELVNKD